MNNFLFEFIGTAFLILLGDGVVANVVLNKTKGNNGQVIALQSQAGDADQNAENRRHETGNQQSGQKEDIS